MTFGSPALLWLLVALPPLLYARARAAGKRRAPTTTSAVWRRFLAETESTARRRIRVSKEVLLEGALLLGLLLSAAGPRLPASAGRTVLLIEDGIASAAEPRRREIRGIADDSAKDADDVRIFRIGKGRIDEISDVDSLAEKIGSRPEFIDWQKAVAHAKETADRVVVVAGKISEDDSDRLDRGVRIRGLRSAVPNVGWTAVNFRTDFANGRTAVLAVVEKSSWAPSGAVICGLSAGGESITRTIDVASGGRATFQATFASGSTESVEIVVKPAPTAVFADAIAADDRIHAYLSKGAGRALVAEGLDSFADALSCLEFEVVVGDAKAAEHYDLVVASSEIGGETPSIVLTPQSSGRFIVKENTAPRDFLLRSADGIIFDRPSAAKIRGVFGDIDVQKSRARPIFFADDAIIVAVADEIGSACIAADPQRTPFFEQPEFPIFVRTVLESLSSSYKRRRFSTLRTGGDERFFGSADVRSVRYRGRGEDGELLPDSFSDGRLHLPFAGSYEIEIGGERRLFETTVLDAVATRASAGTDRAASDGPSRRPRDISVVVVVISLIVFASLVFLRAAGAHVGSSGFDGAAGR